MDDLINTINYALDCGSQRLQWYIQTGDARYMDDCKNYIAVVNVYMNELERSKAESGIKT